MRRAAGDEEVHGQEVRHAVVHLAAEAAKMDDALYTLALLRIETRKVVSEACFDED